MGLKEENFGDVNLWNFETDPNLKEAKMRLESEEEQIDYIKNNLGNQLTNSYLTNYKEF